MVGQQQTEFPVSQGEVQSDCRSRDNSLWCELLIIIRQWFLCSWLLVLSTLNIRNVSGADDYNVLNRDGSYEFGYDNPDSFHHSQANRNNVVQGEFGSRNPGTGAIDTTQYTAGPRGFRPRGKTVARKYDLNQSGPRPVGSRDDPYFDPNEDPSYNFAFRSRTYNRQEAANRLGDVTGKYTFIDDIGERHNVEYIAGRNTGFHVKSPFPDSNPRAYGPLYFNGRGRPIPRGRTSIQRGLDGSYRFISAGPDQRRTETSDSTGHVRGSYTYLDDKGVQHSVHYIAGPETGYRVLKNVKGPHLPTLYPFGRPEIIPADFYDYLSPNVDDVFDTAASGHIKPPKGGSKPSRPNQGGDQFNFDNGSDISGGSGFDKFDGSSGRPGDSGGTGSFGGPSGSGGAGGSGGFGSGVSGGSGTGGTGFGQDGTGSGPSGSGGFGTGPSGTGGPGSGASGVGSGSRPGGTSRPPFGSGVNRPGIRPPRPSYEDDLGSDDFDLFGSTGSTSVKPPFGGSTSRPPSAGGTADGSFPDDGSYKPSGDDGSYRPGPSGGSGFGRPGNEYGVPRPTGPSGGSGGSTVDRYPSPGRPGGSRPTRPDYSDVGSNDVNDLGIFGGGSGGSSRPPGGGIGIGIGGGSSEGGRPGGAGGGAYDDRGTIVRNLGDRLFSVPPGVSVRAHVQAIDLLPLGPRSPSPGEQEKAESREELKAETSNIEEEELSTDASSTNATITQPPSNATEAVSL